MAQKAQREAAEKAAAEGVRNASAADAAGGADSGDESGPPLYMPSQRQSGEHGAIPSVSLSCYRFLQICHASFLPGADICVFSVSAAARGGNWAKVGYDVSLAFRSHELRIMFLFTHSQGHTCFVCFQQREWTAAAPAGYLEQNCRALYQHCQC